MLSHFLEKEFDKESVWNNEVRPMMKRILTNVAISRQELQELCRSLTTFELVCGSKVTVVDRIRSFLEEIFEEARQRFASMPVDMHYLESLVSTFTQLIKIIPSFCLVFSVAYKPVTTQREELNMLALAKLMLITWNKSVLTPLKPFWCQAITNVRQGFIGTDSHDDTVLQQFRDLWMMWNTLQLDPAEWENIGDGSDDRCEMERFVEELHRSHVIEYENACLETLVEGNNPRKRSLDQNTEERSNTDIDSIPMKRSKTD